MELSNQVKDIQTCKFNLSELSRSNPIGDLLIELKSSAFESIRELTIVWNAKLT